MHKISAQKMVQALKKELSCFTLIQDLMSFKIEKNSFGEQEVQLVISNQDTLYSAWTGRIVGAVLNTDWSFPTITVYQGEVSENSVDLGEIHITITRDKSGN